MHDRTRRANAVQSTLVASARSLVGIETVLRAEGVSFSRNPKDTRVQVVLLDARTVAEEGLGRADDSGRRLVLVAGSAEGTAATERVLGMGLKHAVEPTGAVLIASFASDELPGRMSRLLEEFGMDRVVVPIPGSIVEPPTGFEEVMTAVVEGLTVPIVAVRDRFVLVTADLGSSLVTLLTEGYAEVEEETEELSGPVAAVYKRVPFGLRLMVYKYAWRRMRSRSAESLDFTTQTPVDPAGWALHNLLMTAIRISVPVLPGIWRWPDGAPYALCLTHDIEPRPFAYEEGLPRLLEILGSEGVESTISIVGDPGFPLPVGVIEEAVAGGHEIISHGLKHDGRFNLEDGPGRIRRVRESRRLIAEAIGVDVRGFRTPWLQRTQDIAEVLEAADIRYDSSLVDSDTSLKKAWHGKGISYNYPHRLLSRNGSARVSDVLELPIAGPQDMEMVFAGFGLERCAEALLEKLAWSHSIGGVHVVIVHAGVYGPDDADMRESLLRAIIEGSRDDAPWIASLGSVDRWWRMRDFLRVEVEESEGAIEAHVLNPGPETAEAVWMDTGDGTLVEVGEVPVGGEVILQVTQKR